MAAISRRKKADGSIVYDARITIKQAGEIKHRESKTFYQKATAQTWAKRRERELQEELAKTGTVNKKYTWADVAKIHLDYLNEQEKLKRPIAQLDICKIGEKDIVAHLRKRITEDKAKPQTVNNDLAYLGSVIRHAAVFLDLPVDLNGLELAKEKAKAHDFVARSNRRERRLKRIEEAALLDFFEKTPARTYVADILRFALASARRQTEIMHLQWEDLDTDHQTIVVRDMKHPKIRFYTKTAKLTNQALEIIERQSRTGRYIFPHNPKTIGTYFRNACKILEIDDLRFHDLRHEATSRLFEAGYSIIEVQHFTLHEDWKTLKRYTHLRAEDVKLRE